jgi:hypothetical protein
MHQNSQRGRKKPMSLSCSSKKKKKRVWVKKFVDIGPEKWKWEIG